MTALTSNLSLNTQYGTKDYQQQHGSSSSSSYVVEEIKGLIKVHKDGYVERPNIVPFVTCDLNPNVNIISRDIIIDNVTNIWARFYVPISQKKLPLLIYFHGGGFCVGSAAWSCYHDFLAKLSSKVECLIMSVNYRLAPENPLPAPYDDGLKALTWLKQKLLYQNEANDECEWWIKNCNFSSVFLGGDSAGGNIAYNVAKRVFSCESVILKPLKLKGLILIQPFFGGEVRTISEKCMVQLSGSALNLEAYDTYWRLALPYGEDRDHPWCNPLMNLEELKVLMMPCLVCISEMDILKDRNLEFCDALRREGKRVECEVFKDVGHAFQILSKSKVSNIRAIQMMARVKSFISI